ncbi:MAG TPA: efflux RND transporter periplasmic adaptor subunit, partial [Labilithrix sp.]
MKKKNVKSVVGMFCVLAVLVILVVSIWHKLVPNAQAAVAVVAPNEAKVPEKKDDDKDKKLQLSDKVIADAHVRVEPAMKEVIVAKLSVTGEILADPDKSARVTSPVAGRVERIAIKEGDTVKRGDVLAVVRVPELGKARATHASASARATAARSNADRLRELADHGFAAKQEALNADAEAVAFARDAQAAQEQLGAIGSGATGSGSELALRAPIGGI